VSGGPRPRARDGLLAADHSKRGRRLVSILDPTTLRVTLLEPWEHAVLLLLDGQRTLDAVLALLAPEAEGQAIDRVLIERCVRGFLREGLVEPEAEAADVPPAPGPITLTALRLAALEWTPVAEPALARAVPPPVHTVMSLFPRARAAPGPALVVDSLLDASELRGVDVGGAPLDRGALFAAVDEAMAALGGADNVTATVTSRPPPRGETERGPLLADAARGKPGS
jgi:hypothetical protein